VVRAQEICVAGDLRGFEANEGGQELLWEARHDAALAIEALYGERRPMTTDVCVPVSEFPGALRHARQTVEDAGFEGSILGHVGDGNYHAVFPVDVSDDEEPRVAEAVGAEIVRYALERDGTCTGEHGVGFGKMEHLECEHGVALDFTHGIKGLADPRGVMNPGKIFSGA
jgi:D-lactate dehydrogenase (cytochrome)